MILTCKTERIDADKSLIGTCYFYNLHPIILSSCDHSVIVSTLDHILCMGPYPDNFKHILMTSLRLGVQREMSHIYLCKLICINKNIRVSTLVVAYHIVYMGELGMDPSIVYDLSPKVSIINGSTR